MYEGVGLLIQFPKSERRRHIVCVRPLAPSPWLESPSGESSSRSFSPRRPHSPRTWPLPPTAATAAAAVAALAACLPCPPYCLHTCLRPDEPACLLTACLLACSTPTHPYRTQATIAPDRRGGEAGGDARGGEAEESRREPVRRGRSDSDPRGCARGGSGEGSGGQADPRAHPGAREEGGPGTAHP